MATKWLTTLRGWFTRAPEGKYRPGPYYFLDGSWLGATPGRLMNWFQAGYRPQRGPGSSAMVEACVSAYAQTVAMCPGQHWVLRPDGGRDRVTTSALSRVLKRPNDYQTISDFLLNLTRRLYEQGEAFALGIRNARGEIQELHLMRSGHPSFGADGSVYYSLAGNEIIQARFDMTSAVPARDVLHVRLTTPFHPLKGVSPILAATLELALSGAALSQQIMYYLNEARPSYILETEAPLKRDQVRELDEQWQDKTTGENAGKTPILTHGLTARPVTGNAVDLQLVEMLKMSDQNVALTMQIPLAILGIGATNYASTEILMQQWISKGLGFLFNHIEVALGDLYRLSGFPDEYVEFDMKALLRPAFKDRIEALARGVISGIYSPDEARAEEDLGKVPGGFGDMPRVQQQVVPLSYGANLQPPAPGAPTPPAPAPDPNAPDGTPPSDQQNAAAVLARSIFRARLRNDDLDIAA